MSTPITSQPLTHIDQTQASQQSANPSVTQNTENATEVAKRTGQITQSISSNQSAKSFHITKVLTQYGLSKADGENISAFSEALLKQIDTQIEKQSTPIDAKDWDKGDTKLSQGVEADLEANLKASKALKSKIENATHIKTGFLTKLKALCAKIASFFGDNSKVEKLQNEGLSKLNELKKMLTTGTMGPQLLTSFIKDNIENKEAMSGMFKVITGKEYGEAQINTLTKILTQSTESKEKLLNLMANLNSTEDSFEKAKILKDAIFSIIGQVKTESDITQEKQTTISLMSSITNIFTKKALADDTSRNYYGGRFIGELTSRYNLSFSEIIKHSKNLAEVNDGKKTDGFRDLIGKPIDKQAYISLEKKQLANAIEELNTIKTKHDISIALFEKIKPKYYGSDLGTMDLKNLSKFAQESLGNEEFLSQFKAEILDGSLPIRDKNLLLNDDFVKTIDFNDKQQVEGFTKALLWADKSMIQEGVEKNLSQETQKITNGFSSHDKIFMDIARGYDYIFKIEGKEISLSGGEIFLSDEESKNGKTKADKIFEYLNKELEQLSKDNQEKIKKFCDNFPSQGCFIFALYNEQKNPEYMAPIQVNHSTFTIEFKDNGDTFVSAKAEGKGKVQLSSTIIDYHPEKITEKIDEQLEVNPSLETNCEFNFTYKGGIEACKGSASDIAVTEFEQNITFE